MVTRQQIRRMMLSFVFPVVMAGLVLTSDLIFRSDEYVSLATLIETKVLSGVCAMIIIETIKRLVPVRGWYQEDLWQHAQNLRWHEPQGSERPDQSSSAWALAPRKRYEGQVGSIFNLPTEQMIAQLAAHSQVAGIDQPDDPIALEQREALGLDRLHALIAGRWRHYIRVTAAWLSGAVALLLTSIHVSGVPDSRSIPISALFFGGFVAWLARDVTAVVERWRR